MWGIDFAELNLKLSNQNGVSVANFEAGITRKITKTKSTVIIMNKIKNDIMKAKEVTIRMQKEFVRLKYTDREISKKIFHLFQTDVVPGLSGSVLKSCSQRQFVKPMAVSRNTQIITWVIMIGVQVAMLFYMYLFLIQQTSRQQMAWIKSVYFMLVIEVVFTCSLNVVLMHVIIPKYMGEEVSKAKIMMTLAIHRILKKMNQQILHKNTYREGILKQLCSIHEEIHDNATSHFNIAEYVMPSYRLAKEFAHIEECNVILSFTSDVPSASFADDHDSGKKSYSIKFVAFYSLIKILCIKMAVFVVNLNPQVQDMIQNMTFHALFGYIVVAFIYFWRASPIASPVVGVTILLIMFGTYYYLVKYKHNEVKENRK